MRSRPARDAIQFTLDVDTLDVKEDGNYNTKNLSKAEMDAEKRLRRKRTRENVIENNKNDTKIKSAATDLNKKRKVTETVTQEIVKEKTAEEAKPWEQNAEEEQPVDERWDVCENCQ